MRVVLYARVSSIKQERSGESIPNQLRALNAAAARNGWQIVAVYTEAASAGTVAGRAEFSRMLDELATTKPEAVIIDTLDRYSRNLRDGLNVLEDLRKCGVGLLPLDLDRYKPLNLEDDDDWKKVVSDLTEAEAFRRRLRKNLRKSWQGRRDRGATMVNRPAFGIKREGDIIVPSEDAWVCKEIDARALAGESLSDIARWAVSIVPAGFKTYHGVRAMLANPNYVAAGIRTLETQAALDALLIEMRGRFGQRRVHEHEFSGVFLCGRCLELGTRRLMHGWMVHHNDAPTPSVACQRRVPNNMGPHHPMFMVSAKPLSGWWASLVMKLAGEDFLAHALPEAKDQHALERRIADLDQRHAQLKTRRDNAVSLLGHADADVKAQVEQLLRDVANDERAIIASQQAVLGELRASPSQRDAASLAEYVEQFAEVYAESGTADRNFLNRQLCVALGSNPRLERDEGARGGWAPIIISWPELGIEPVRVYARERAQDDSLHQPSAPSRSGRHESLRPCHQPQPSQR